MFTYILRDYRNDTFNVINREQAARVLRHFAKMNQRGQESMLKLFIL